MTINEFNKGRRKIVSITLLILILFSYLFISIPHNNQLNSNHHDPRENLGLISPENNKVSMAVDPYELYYKEPAPVGIADFGLASGNTPYEYSTKSFEGNIIVHSLSVYNKSINQSATWMSFQLNVNLVFNNGNIQYVYWIQNVAEINTSTNFIGFVDNIWNFSAPSAQMNNSSVSGTGTVTRSGNLSYYYSIANQSLSGNDVNLSLPYQVDLEVNSSVYGGIPHVTFSYNDGFGWIYYDNVSFIFAKQLDSPPNFLVDGYNYEPTGYTYYDAELILGGPGNGTVTRNNNSLVNMNLLFWNGHNYQNVPNAFNFGSNTAEGISNTISQMMYYTANGTIFSNVTNGPGKLGMLYDSNELGSIRVNIPLSSGILIINGTDYKFYNNEVNVTLYPSANSTRKGYYTLEIKNNDGKIMWKDNVTLYAGQELVLNADLYTVKFLENGLPYGMIWTLHLSNGQSYVSNNSTMSIEIGKGNYSFSIFIPFEKNPIYNGTFIVNDKNITVYLDLKVNLYSIDIEENGLPPSLSWGIVLKNEYIHSTNSTIILYLQNGTYSFTVQPIQGFRSNISYYIFNISGSSITIEIGWKPVLYNVTIRMNGLENGTEWKLEINGSTFYGETINQTFYSNSSKLTIMESNGSYVYRIYLPGNFYSSSTTNNFVVNGSSYNLSISVKYKANNGLQINQQSSGIIILGIIVLAAGTIYSLLKRVKKK